MQWLLTYVSIALAIGYAVTVDILLVVSSYATARVIVAAHDAGCSHDAIATYTDATLYRIASICEHQAMEVLLLAVLTMRVMFSIARRHIGGSEALDYSAWLANLSIICLVTVAFAAQYHGVPSDVESVETYPLHVNYLTAVHPAIQLLFTQTMLLTDTLDGHDTMEFTCLLGILVLVSGGAWSSALFGWGGFWVWDPVESILFGGVCICICVLHGAIKLRYVALLYSILGVVCLKMGLVGGVHTFNVICEDYIDVNTAAIVVYAFNAALCLRMYGHTAESVISFGRRSMNFAWVLVVPMSIVTSNTIAERLNQGDLTMVPHEYTNLLLAYFVLQSLYIANRYAEPLAWGYADGGGYIDDWAHSIAIMAKARWRIVMAHAAIIIVAVMATYYADGYAVAAYSCTPQHAMDTGISYGAMVQTECNGSRYSAASDCQFESIDVAGNTTWRIHVDTCAVDSLRVGSALISISAIHNNGPTVMYIAAYSLVTVYVFVYLTFAALNIAMRGTSSCLLV